jgi:hypothetical protein
MLKNTVNILHPDEKYSKYVIMEYDGNVPRLFGDKRSIELLIPKDIDVVTENAVVDAIESGSLFDDKKDIENKVDYITMTHVPALGMMHRHMNEPHGLHHAIGMVVGAMHPDNGHFGSADSDMTNGKNFTADLTKHGDEKDTSVLDLTSDYLNIKDKMGKGFPVELRRSLKDIPDEVSDIKKVKPEDTVDEDDYEEIGLDHEDKDDEYEEDDERDSNEKKHDKKKHENEDEEDNDEDEKDYAGDDDEREHSIEKFLKKRKKNVKPDIEIDEEMDVGDPPQKVNSKFGFHDESAELSIVNTPSQKTSSYSNNGNHSSFTNTSNVPKMDNYHSQSNNSSYNKSQVERSIQSHQINKPIKKSSYQESYEYDEQSMFKESNAILMKPKSLKPIKREVVTYILTQKNNIHDANDQSMLASYACAKLELVDFYLNCIDTHDYRYIVPHNRQYLVQMQNDLNRALQEVLRVKPVNRMDRPWHVNVTYPQGWGG